MLVRALVAVTAVIAVPIVANGAEPEKQVKDTSMKKVCRTHVATGSRLSQVQRCMTAREREEYRLELNTDLSRQQVDRRP